MVRRRLPPSSIPPSTHLPPQACWRGAEVAVKLSLSSSKGDLSPAVTVAISGRMLAHPHVVNIYLVSVMSGEEVLAAIEATARSEAGEGASDGGDEVYVIGSSHMSAKRAALVREVDRLLGSGSESESEPGGSGAFASNPGNGEGPGPPSAEAEAGLLAQTAEDASYLPADLPPNSNDPPPPRRPSTAFFSGPNARQLRALEQLSFDQAARVMALAPDQHVTAIVVSASVE